MHCLHWRALLTTAPTGRDGKRTHSYCVIDGTTRCVPDFVVGVIQELDEGKEDLKGHGAVDIGIPDFTSTKGAHTQH